jgi:hypothetical protein
MITIEFKIQTNIKDTVGYPTAPEVTGAAFANHITNMLTDIHDPQTGESPRIACHSHPKGIMLSLHGSASVRAEAEIRLASMIKATSRKSDAAENA